MAYLKDTRQNTGRMSNERLLKLSIRRVGLDPAAPKKQITRQTNWKLIAE